MLCLKKNTMSWMLRMHTATIVIMVLGCGSCISSFGSGDTGTKKAATSQGDGLSSLLLSGGFLRL